MSRHTTSLTGDAEHREGLGVPMDSDAGTSPVSGDGSEGITRCPCCRLVVKGHHAHPYIYAMALFRYYRMLDAGLDPNTPEATA